MRTNGMRHVQLLNASPPKIGARGNDDNERRQHNAEGGRGLQPAGTAAAFVRDVVGDISDGAAVLAAQGKALDHPQSEQNERRSQTRSARRLEPTDRFGAHI